MIKPIQHCHLCDLKDIIPGKGPVCTLTSKKPDFVGTCSSIELKEEMRSKLTEAIQNYETIKYSKALVLINFYSFLTLGLVVIVGAYLFYTYLWNIGWFSIIPLIIAVAGFVLIGYAIGPINYYRNHIRSTKMKLDKIEAALSLYRKSFNYKFEIIKRRHEEHEKQARVTRLDIS